MAGINAIDKDGVKYLWLQFLNSLAGKASKDYVDNQMWISSEVYYGMFFSREPIEVPIFAGLTDRVVIKNNASFQGNLIIRFSGETIFDEPLSDMPEEFDIMEATNIKRIVRQFPLGYSLSLEIYFYSVDDSPIDANIIRYDLRSFADGAYRAVSADYLQSRDEYLTSLIDAKADASDLASKVYTATVDHTAFSSATSAEGLTYYTSTVTVPGITVDDVPVIDVALSSDVDAAVLQLEAYGCVNKVETGADSITVYCFTDLPEVSFDIRLKIK